MNIGVRTVFYAIHQMGQWKHFNNKYHDFASEPQNMRVGLCTDGFNPYALYLRSYSIWLVVVTPYNTPPKKCMTTLFIFPTCVIPGAKILRTK